MRNLEVTEKDLMVMYKIWRYRGYLSSWILEEKILGDSETYPYKRLTKLRERGYIDKRPVLNRQWRRATCWYLKRRGLQALKEAKLVPEIDLQNETKKWSRWRNDSREAQWRRILIADAARTLEKECGWMWIPKYELMSENQQAEDGSMLGGAFLNDDEVYGLIVVDSLPVNLYKESSFNAYTEGRLNAVIVLSLVKEVIDEWGEPNPWEYVVPYKWGIDTIINDDQWKEAFRQYSTKHHHQNSEKTEKWRRCEQKPLKRPAAPRG